MKFKAAVIYLFFFLCVTRFFVVAMEEDNEWTPTDIDFLVVLQQIFPEKHIQKEQKLSRADLGVGALLKVLEYTKRAHERATEEWKDSENPLISFEQAFPGINEGCGVLGQNPVACLVRHNLNLAWYENFMHRMETFLVTDENIDALTSLFPDKTDGSMRKHKELELFELGKNAWSLLSIKISALQMCLNSEKIHLADPNAEIPSFKNKLAYLEKLEALIRGNKKGY